MEPEDIFSLDILIFISSVSDGIGELNWVPPQSVWRTADERPEWFEFSSMKDGFQGEKTNLNVPKEFAISVLRKCNNISFFVSHGILRQNIREDFYGENPIFYSTLQTFENFGLNSIYEAIEYGSIRL